MAIIEKQSMIVIGLLTFTRDIANTYTTNPDFNAQLAMNSMIYNIP